MAKRANLDRALSRWKFGRIMDGRIRILKHKKIKMHEDKMSRKVWEKIIDYFF